MKKRTILTSMAMTCLVAGADTVNFTTGEGYTAPSPLADYAGWSGSTGFVVNTSGTGTVGWSGPTSAMMNYENGASSSANTIEVSTQFRMTRVAGFGSGVFSRPVVSLSLETDAIGETADGLNDVQVTFSRLNSVTNYRLDFKNMTLGSADEAHSALFDQELMGIAVNGDTSDLLELKMVLYRGATETDWTADVSLYNVTDSIMLTQILNRSFSSTESYFNSTLYGAISGSSADADKLGIADRQIESFTIIPEPATMGLISLTTVGLLFFRRVFTP